MFLADLKVLLVSAGRSVGATVLKGLRWAAFFLLEATRRAFFMASLGLGHLADAVKPDGD